jgi:tetratricopeptide (TPR) repeat protein
MAEPPMRRADLSPHRLPALPRRALLPLALATCACAGACSAQSGLPGKAAAGLATARRWRSDAVLVGVQAQDYAGNGRFFLTYSFYSPSAGTGFWIISAPGQSDQTREAGPVSWGTQPIPPDFLDLPAAIAQARKAGMGAVVDHATLRAGSQGVLWEITPARNDPHWQVYRVLAAGQPQAAPNQNVEALLTRGQNEVMNRNLDAGIADLTTVIRLDPHRSEAYVARGQAYVGNQQYDEAFADLTRALQLDPKNGIAYWKLGDVYAHRGEHDEAIEAFTQAMAFGFDDAAPVYHFRSLQYDALRQWDRALADENRAIQLDGDNGPEYYRARADVYTHQGRRDEAIADLKRALQIDPNDQATKKDLERLEGIMAEERRQH